MSILLPILIQSRMSDCTEHVEREGSETNSHTAQIVQASSNSTGTQVQPNSGTTTVVDSNPSTRTPETSDCYEQPRACESQAPMALQDSISDTQREIHDDGFVDSTPSMRTVTSTCIPQTPAQALQCEVSDVLTGQDEDVPDETGTIPDSSENKEDSVNGKSIKNTISAATSTFSPHVLRQQMSNLSATMSDGLSQVR
ncbi:hypothetical protein SARC_04911 [Sphaeroforma arctica JP610]|uniref:Uncharacterized protein n=1 Tax=Sphaeroforma arctica JP610 TaxID=667725 RepID=A0A0L0G1U7_9EUKA|nr:hypothetical protein SARC_04911 [Sphaeroforma arctica JP610]KNC82806.1 hypothetical protein SARC_04911 [Sphaeroforma arctica JP610]|eukprot:XP_014156708.1 hypothetical protein SARC_04911 [Sphaeroforma arctica JP610]